MPTIPNIEPKKIRSGLTIVWQRSFSAYSYDDGYTATFYTINGAGSKASITGVYASGVWTFTLTADLNILVKGKYTLFGFVQKGTGATAEKYPIYTGSLEVEASLTTATTAEQRSDLQLQLDRIQTAINNYLIDPVEAITISTSSGGSRTFQRPSLKQLYSFRALTQKDLRIELAKENIRNGRPTGRTILSRLTND